MNFFSHKTLMRSFCFFHLPRCPCALWNLCLLLPLWAEGWGHSLSCLLSRVLHFSGLKLFQSLPPLSSWCSDIQMSHQMHYFFRLLDWFYMWNSFQMPVLNILVCLQFAWDPEQNSIRCVYEMTAPQAWSSAERGEFVLCKLQLLGHPELSNISLWRCRAGPTSESGTGGQGGGANVWATSFYWTGRGASNPWGSITFAQNAEYLPHFSLSSFILKSGVCLEPTFFKLAVKILSL